MYSFIYLHIVDTQYVFNCIQRYLYLSQSLADIQIQFQYLSPCSPLIYFKIRRENDESNMKVLLQKSFIKGTLVFFINV